MGAFDTLVAYVDEVKTQDEVAKAAETFVTQFRYGVYHQVGDNLEKMSALAKQYGMNALMAKLPADIAATTRGILAQLGPIWQGMTGNPFPDFPDEPVPAEPVIPPTDGGIV